MPTHRHDYNIHPCFYTGPALTPGQLPPLDNNMISPTNANWSSQHNILYDIDIQTGNPPSPSRHSHLPRSASGVFRLQQFDNDLNPLHPDQTPAQAAAALAPRWTAIVVATPGPNNQTQYLFALGLSSPSPPRQAAATGPATFTFAGVLGPVMNDGFSDIINDAAELAAHISPHGITTRNIPKGPGVTTKAAINAFARATTRNLITDTLGKAMNNSQPVLNAHVFESPRGTTLIAARPSKGPLTGNPSQLRFRSAAHHSHAEYAPSLVRNRMLMTTTPLMAPMLTSSGRITMQFTSGQTYAVKSYFTIPTNAQALPGAISVTGTLTAISTPRHNTVTYIFSHPKNTAVTPGSAGDRSTIIGRIDTNNGSYRANPQPNLAADVYMMAYQTSTEMLLEVGLVNITGSWRNISAIELRLNAVNTIKVWLPRGSDRSPTLLLQDPDSILQYGQRTLPTTAMLAIATNTTLPFLKAVSTPPLTGRLRLPFRQRSTNPNTHLLPRLLQESAVGEHFPLTITPSEKPYSWQLMARRLVQPFNQTPYLDADFLAYP